VSSDTVRETIRTTYYQAYSTIRIAVAPYVDLFGTSELFEGLFGTDFVVVQLVVATIDVTTTETGLLLATPFTAFATTGFAWQVRAAHRESASAVTAD